MFSFGDIFSRKRKKIPFSSSAAVEERERERERGEDERGSAASLLRLHELVRVCVCVLIDCCLLAVMRSGTFGRTAVFDVKFVDQWLLERHLVFP